MSVVPIEEYDRLHAEFNRLHGELNALREAHRAMHGEDADTECTCPIARALATTKRSESSQTSPGADS